MKIETLNKAIKEAERFIEAAKAVPIVNSRYTNGKPRIYAEEYTKQSAACKRASMDLTRVLADLRQGR